MVFGIIWYKILVPTTCFLQKLFVDLEISGRQLMTRFFACTAVLERNFVLTMRGVPAIGGLVYMCLPGFLVNLRYFAQVMSHLL